MWGWDRHEIKSSCFAISAQCGKFTYWPEHVYIFFPMLLWRYKIYTEKQHFSVVKSQQNHVFLCFFFLSSSSIGSFQRSRTTLCSYTAYMFVYTGIIYMFSNTSVLFYTKKSILWYNWLSPAPRAAFRLSLVDIFSIILVNSSNAYAYRCGEDSIDWKTHQNNV